MHAVLINTINFPHRKLEIRDSILSHEMCLMFIQKDKHSRQDVPREVIELTEIVNICIAIT